MSLTQKEAVFQAITSVVGEIRNNRAELTDAQFDNVLNIVTQGIMSGAVGFKDKAKAKHDSEEKVRDYTKGMIKNWLRKDTRLNGGVDHEIKNPGSRTGSNDPEMKALRTLLKIQKAEGNVNGVVEVQKAIEVKIARFKAERAAKGAADLEINPNLIPDSLKHLLKSEEEVVDEILDEAAEEVLQEQLEA